MGEHGAGQTTKACNQLALLVTAQGAAEALTLARRSGLDPAKVREVMLGGVAASRVLELFGKRMVDRDFAPASRRASITRTSASRSRSRTPRARALPAGAVVMQHINALMGRGDGANDLSALITVIEEMGPR